MDNSFWIFMGPTLGGIALYALINASVLSTGRALHQRFVALGDVAGMPKEKIVEAVGNPTSISNLPDGKILLQWQATGCHMALRFNGDTCEGYTHQHVQ